MSNKSKASQKTLQLNLKGLNSDTKLEKLLNEMFRHAFITNCHLDEASVTGEELETLEELSIEEVLDNFKDLLNDLLNYKKEVQASDKAQLLQRSEQFEAMLQKLEADIRNHIRIEHELKLHIESMHSKLEDLEKNKQDSTLKIQELEDKLKNGERFKNDHSKDKVIQKYEIECNKLKNILEDKIKECERLKKDMDKVKKLEKSTASIENFKKKVEDKTCDLGKVQKIAREQGNEKSFVRKIEKRGERCSQDSTPSPFRSIKENENNIQDLRPGSVKKSLRGHLRSVSDTMRVVNNRKPVV